MHIYVLGLSFFRYKKFWIIQLACCIILGLLVGISIPAFSSSDTASLMLSAVSCRLSIVGLLVSSILPFLISAFAVSLSQPFLLLLQAFLKMLCFGFCSVCVINAFGSYGWLVRLLFLFTDFIIIPLLCWLWIRSNRIPYTSWVIDCLCCCAIGLVAGCIDRIWICKFLTYLV